MAERRRGTDGVRVAALRRRIESWRRTRHDLLLTTVGRGQEFVLEPPRATLAHAWLAGLFRAAFPSQSRRRDGFSRRSMT